MMDISEMSDEQKSVMLAKLCQWIRPAGDDFMYGTWLIETEHPGWRRNYWRKEPVILPGFNLYNESYMALAWRVLNWAIKTKPGKVMSGNFYIHPIGADVYDFVSGFNIANGKDIFSFDAHEAQRLWLDKILELAIAAGMIK